MTAKPTGIIFLSTNKFDFYQSAGTTILTCDFPAAVVRDMEILSADAFESAIQSFLQTQTISPCALVFILSSTTLFEKDFSGLVQPQQEIAVQQFLESIPFERVSSSIIHLKNGVRIIAANKDFYEPVKAVFENSGFTTQAVLPASVFGIDTDGLTIGTARRILQKLESVKEYNMLQDEKLVIGNEKKEAFFNKNKNLILLAVFFILIAVALVLIIIALGIV